MVENYFKTLLRLLKKNKLLTAINVIGMTVAFASSILLAAMVYYEFSYNDFHKNGERIYKLYTQSTAPSGEEFHAHWSYPVTSELKKQNTGIEYATRVKQNGSALRYNGKTIDGGISLVDQDFFNIFTFPVESGAFKDPLAGNNHIVLTKEMSEKLFGKENPVGTNIEANIGGKWIQLSISAVLEKMPKNSSFDFSALARTETDPDYSTLKNKWNFTNHHVYIQLKPGIQPVSVERSFKDFLQLSGFSDSSYMRKQGYIKNANGQYEALKLLPLKDLHFNLFLSNGDAVSKSFMYVLLLIAILILLTACFNFVNLNTGLSLNRTKEIGIRKCLGAGKKQVWLQVWGESFLIMLLAMLSGIVISVISMKGFKKLMDASVDASVLREPVVIAFLLILLILVSFLASGYSSWLLTRVKVIAVLKGKLLLKKSVGFKNALIALQFVIAIVLISSTIIIYQQFQHLRKAPLGYNTSSLISVPVKDADKGRDIIRKMKALLVNQSSVKSISGSAVNLGSGRDGSTSMWGFGFDYYGKSVQTNFLPVDYDILKTMELPLKAGRDFSDAYSADTLTSVIVTESVVKQMALKDPLGVSFYADSSRPKWSIVGVIPDFHLYSHYSDAKPLVLAMDPTAIINYVFIRVNSSNPVSTMSLIENAYKKAEPGVEFKGSYVDENIERWYAREKRLSKLFGISSAIAIILSCMGLFGLSFIMIKQREKEIGVRKVLGASVTHITSLVSKSFLKPIAIAFIIALPLGIWAMDKWLQDFVYRITIQWWVFVLAGIMAFLIAVITISFQTIKAALANPVKSLRTE